MGLLIARLLTERHSAMFTPCTHFSQYRKEEIQCFLYGASKILIFVMKPGLSSLQIHYNFAKYIHSTLQQHLKKLQIRQFFFFFAQMSYSVSSSPIISVEHIANSYLHVIVCILAIWLDVINCEPHEPITVILKHFDSLTITSY